MKDNKKKSPWLALPFFAVLNVLTAVSFILPLRPSFSESEKRDLAAFPEFSAEALVSGDYFSDITLWFSDTFPGREDWISLSQYTTNFHGYSEIAIEGALTEVDTIPVEVQVPETQPRQPEEYIPAEETQPETTEDPAEPEETQWGGIDIENYEVNLGTVIQIGDAGYNQLAFSQPMSDLYISTISGFADRMAEIGVRVISAPCPTSVGIMIEPEYLAQLNCSRQDEMLNYLHGNMSDNVVKVDMFQRLVEHNDEYIYFRTDHHWTALGAYYAYQEICDAAGMEAAPLENFEVWDQGDFTGTLYFESTKRNQLRIDTCIAYNPPGDLTTYITDDKYGTFETEVLTDMTNAGMHAKYYVFLYGDNALTEIINHDIPEGKNCVVVKDSFGNPLVPFLTQNYHKVYAVDFRHYRTMNLQAFVEAYEIDDVIFGHMLGMSQSDDVNDTFSWLCGLK